MMYWDASRRFMKGIIKLVAALCLSSLVSPTLAFEHKGSLVNFIEYSDDVVVNNKQENKPYFLLFSAEWCHWCHEFAERTLVRQDVADYLNQNFVNVFIDADIHNAAYIKYRAMGLPYTVFLNPDGSLYYQYSGTLYADSFLKVIKTVQAEAGVDKYALGMEANHISYTPPADLVVDDLTEMPDIFRQGLLDNFDPSEYGLGRGQKAIFPRSFLYLLKTADEAERERALQWLRKTLERAIDRIYDPVEGGFFRYAEEADWEIPHYEKFADLNAGAVLLLYQVNLLSPSPKLKLAADKTLNYLTSTLFDDETGSFLSFQVADTFYYSVDENKRELVTRPRVVDRIFTDRLAITLGYLIEVLKYTQDPELENRLRQSLDFLASMIMRDIGMSRYYSISDKRWRTSSGMSDYAYVAKLFADAAAHFQNSFYEDVATKVLTLAVTNFYDVEIGIFIQPEVDDSTNVEYLMEINGLFAQSLISMDGSLGSGGRKVVGSLVRYFSQMVEPLEDRLWNAVAWEFAESYVPYMLAAEHYLSYTTAKHSE
jgi:uncharacterized protein YyaL (SSP411 family)